MTVAPRDVAPAACREEDVAAYLLAHPQFLQQHPEVLSEIAVPHAPGQAVSLVERQMVLMREEIRRLKGLLGRLVDTAKNNEAVATKLHRLAVSLMEAGTWEEVLRLLREALIRDFAADAVEIRIFGEEGHLQGASLPEFTRRDAPEFQDFADCLAAKSPRCGPLTERERRLLFGREETEGETEGSFVTIPLSGRGWEGFLVVGSRDPARYEQDMGTEMLIHLCDIASLVLDHRVL